MLSKGYNLPKKIAIIYSDIKRQYFPTYEQYLTEKNARKDAIIIKKYIQQMGIEVSLIPGNSSLFSRLQRYRPNIVVNLVDSLKGNEYLAATIPAALELLDIPYTGSGMLGKSLDCNKFIINVLLQQHGIPVPMFQLFNNYKSRLNTELRFPLISKLNEVHGAVEINEDAISEDENHLRKRIKYLISTYKQPILVQEFIVGREVVAYILDGLKTKVYLAEKIFSKKRKEHHKYIISSFKDQWSSKSHDSYQYEKYSNHVLQEYVKKAFKISSMYNYGKFDIKIDHSGHYFFLDINYNPAFGPKESECALGYILDLYHVSFFDVIKRLIINVQRNAVNKKLLRVS